MKLTKKNQVYVHAKGERIKTVLEYIQDYTTRSMKQRGTSSRPFLLCFRVCICVLVGFVWRSGTQLIHHASGIWRAGCSRWWIRTTYTCTRTVSIHTRFSLLAGRRHAANVFFFFVVVVVVVVFYFLCSCFSLFHVSTQYWPSLLLRQNWSVGKVYLYNIDYMHDIFIFYCIFNIICG